MAEGHQASIESPHQQDFRDSDTSVCSLPTEGKSLYYSITFLSITALEHVRIRRVTWRSLFLCESETPANPSRAAAMEPIVTAMWSQDRKVRSLAKKVLGSMRIGVVRAMGGGSLGLRLLKYQSKKPFFSFFCPKPACNHGEFDASGLASRG